MEDVSNVCVRSGRDGDESLVSYSRELAPELNGVFLREDKTTHFVLDIRSNQSFVSDDFLHNHLIERHGQWNCGGVKLKVSHILDERVAAVDANLDVEK